MRKIIQLCLILVLIFISTWFFYACRKENNQADYKDKFSQENLTSINKDPIDGGQDFFGIIIETENTNLEDLIPAEIELVGIDNIITTPEITNLNCTGVSKNLLLEYLGLNPEHRPDSNDPFVFTKGVYMLGGTDADLYPVLGLGLPDNQTDFSPYLSCFEESLLYLVLRNPNINDQKIKDQDLVLRSLKKLQRLDLQTASIVEIPSLFNSLPNLTHLNISRTSADNSAYLRDLHKLTSINLYDLNINYTGVQKIKGLNNNILQKLSAKRNALYLDTELSDFIASAYQLKILDLSENSLNNNQLDEILNKISGNIQYLNLSDNNNNGLAYEFSNNNLKNLRYLDLTSTKLFGFSDAFYTLTNIEELYLANNNFSSSINNNIKNEITNLKKLRILALTNTNISSISKEICTIGNTNNKVQIYLSTTEKTRILQDWGENIPNDCHIEFIANKNAKNIKKSFNNIK